MGTIYTELQPLIPGQAYTFYTCLVSQADTDIFKTTVTLAVGDVKLSKDGAAFVNLTILPTEQGTSGLLIISLSATETTGITKFAIIKFSDMAGDEWQDQLITIEAMQGILV